MSYLYLFLAMTFSGAVTIAGRIYKQKNQAVPHISALFNLLVPAFAALGWLILWGMEFSFDPKVLPLSLLYGVGFSFFTIGMLGALKNGPTSLTGLIKQLALVAVSFWGFFFWNTRFTTLGLIGIVLLILSLVLCLPRKQADAQNHRWGKWIFYCCLIAIGNAGCSILQRYQQMIFEYQHKNMFMFFGLLFSALFCLVPALMEDKTHWKSTLKTSWLFPALAGFSAVLTNVFILLLVKREMSAAILYPGVAVGGLILTTLVATLCFRERLQPRQWLGLAFGTVALVFLNL